MVVEKEAPGGVLLVSSFVLYAALSPLLARLISPSGVFGILYAIPLSAAAWRWGRRVGFAAALAGVGFNEIVWLWTRGAAEPASSLHLLEAAAGLALEAAAFILFAWFIAGARQWRSRAHRAEELQRLSERNYLGLIELAPEGAAVVQDMRVAFCNDHLLEMFGYPRSEVIGRRFDLMLHAEERDKAVALYHRRLRGETVNAGEVRFLRRDGAAGWMDYVGKVIEWEGKPAALYLVSDISEKKSLEQQWRQSQKLEALGRLAGGIAHDFNNILQVIVASCDSVSSWTELPPGIRGDVSLAQSAAASGASLTRQLLAFSRTRGSPPGTLDLGSLLQRSEKMLGCAIGDSVALTVVVTEEPCAVRVEESAMQQVFLNLAVNARDAMPVGGSFVIRTAVERVSGGVAGLPNALPDGDYVTVKVTDTGCGMEEETREHLFEPFFTTKEPGSGTGLGLWIVHGIVSRSGGLISVESEAGKGTTFTIRLPRAESNADRASSAAEQRPPRGSERILLVEDESSVRSLVKTMLEDGGYSVDAAPDGRTALELCRNPARRIDLLLTDLAMPGIGGRELAQHVRRFRPRTKVVLMTGGDDPADDLRGASSMIRKPFNARQLLTEVRRMLDSADPVFPAAAAPTG